MHCISMKPNHAAEPEAIFFCSANEIYPANNGAILTVSQIIKSVMTSAAESELVALYINSGEAVPLQQLLE